MQGAFQLLQLAKYHLQHRLLREKELSLLINSRIIMLHCRSIVPSIIKRLLKIEKKEVNPRIKAVQRSMIMGQYLEI